MSVNPFVPVATKKEKEEMADDLCDNILTKHCTETNKERIVDWNPTNRSPPYELFTENILDPDKYLSRRPSGMNELKVDT